MDLKLLLVLAFYCIGFAIGRVIPQRDQWPPPEIVKVYEILNPKCVAETGASTEAIKRFSDGKIHEDEKLKCYMSCLFHETHVVDDDGEVDLKKVEEVYTSFGEEMKQFYMNIKHCNSSQGETQCERAFWYHKCWRMADPKNYFIL